MTEQTTTATAPADTVASPESAVEAAQCGHLVNTDKGPKPCVKPVGHTQEGTPAFEQYGKGHASRLQTRKEYKPIPKNALNSLKPVDPTEEVEYGAVGAAASERDEVQQMIDGHVKDAYQEWVAAGKPEKFNDSPRKRYTFSPELEESFRAGLRSAGRLHSVSVRIAPAKRLDNGKVALYWTAQDIREREQKKNKDEIISEQARALKAVTLAMGLEEGDLNGILARLSQPATEASNEAEQVNA